MKQKNASRSINRPGSECSEKTCQYGYIKTHTHKCVTKLRVCICVGVCRKYGGKAEEQKKKKTIHLFFLISSANVLLNLLIKLFMSFSKGAEIWQQAVGLLWPVRSLRSFTLTV